MRRFCFVLAGVLLILAAAGCVSETRIDLKEVDPDLENGQAIYEDDCILCHEGAIEGAQRLDQRARWQESAEKGFDQLVKNVTNGYQGKYGELPVMGMCRYCTQQDIKDAVAYMLVAADMAK